LAAFSGTAPAVGAGVSAITLLQFHNDVSDKEAVDRLRFDLRWKVALNLPLDFVPPHPTTIGVFHFRLIEHAEERHAFNRLIRKGRAAGFLPDRITLLIDTTPQKGAGAVKDTYPLIRKGLCKILRLATPCPRSVSDWRPTSPPTWRVIAKRTSTGRTLPPVLHT
jgi:hypothetical protein